MRQSAGWRSRRHLHRRQIAPDAVATDSVVAFRQRADDRRLVRKILIERAERHAGPLDDVAHPERFAAFLGHDFGCTCKDALEPLAAALLRWNQTRQRGRAGLGLVRSGFLSWRHAREFSKKRLDGFNTRVYRILQIRDIIVFNGGNSRVSIPQPIVTGLLWFSAIGCGLLAGLYFAFSTFIMTGARPHRSGVGHHGHERDQCRDRAVAVHAVVPRHDAGEPRCWRSPQSFAGASRGRPRCWSAASSMSSACSCARR